MPLKSRVTLRDIARQANVSVSTVSRALNDHIYVNEATRQTVYQAADTLGYPLENLRTTPPQPLTTVTLVNRHSEAIPTSHNDFDFLASEGARAEIEAQNMQVSFERMWLDRRNWSDLISKSGIIWLGGIVDRDFVKALLERHTPFVLLGAHALPLQVNCVMANYAYGISSAVDHLVARGRRHIGLINAPPTTATSEERWSGFSTALIRHGLPVSSEQVISGMFEADSGYHMTQTLLEKYPDVDAIIYSHDMTAMGGLTALKEHGCRIPDDIAVVGCHNYEICRFTDPTLTTISFDMQEMGRMAVRRLCDILAGDKSTWTMVAPTNLIIRNST